MQRTPRSHLARSALLGVALVGALLAVTVSEGRAEPRSSLDSREMSRLLDDLDADVSGFRRDVRRSFERSRRWEPIGRDRELWEELESLERAVDRVRRDYSDREYRGMADDVRRVLERGRAVDGLVGRVELDRSLREQWGRTDGTLGHLARSYGWDYESGVFQTDSREDYRDDRRDTGSDRRYTTRDDREVQDGLKEIERLVDAIAPQLRYRDSKDSWIGLGESILGGVSGVQRPEAAKRSQIETEFAALDEATEDAVRQFDASRRASEVRGEVRTMLRVASGLDASMSSSEVSGKVRNAWNDLRAQLNRLAAIYGLEQLPAG